LHIREIRAGDGADVLARSTDQLIAIPPDRDMH